MENNEDQPCPICGATAWIFADNGQGMKWGNATCGNCGIVSPEVRTMFDLSDDADWHDFAIEELRSIVETAFERERRNERHKIANELLGELRKNSPLRGVKLYNREQHRVDTNTLRALIESLKED